ncbi:hypothetical protein EW146_g6629 [Bondarzewia mesenterica]|uniref:Brix domain-containing protein n=1 Tax=Bondarzewia mesenterica TaxID=1095465 RepID=A0A4S4LNM8_9AGAM|nr:hypothetical protein EW146_g6629 [Bondarzewia mesenterica]
MARRRKNRTHLKGAAQASSSGADNVPKSFIIKHGQVGHSLTQLTRDVRKVMEPNTASRLRERARNKLKDFLTMAPALHVTHLLAFTLTDVAPSMRIVRLSNGPSLSFRVERYSLIKDIQHSSKHSKSQGMVEYLSPPLLVLASFPPPSPTTPPHLPLIMKTFQTLFPPLSPHTLTLSSARRIVLVAYNAERGTIDFRHYRITVKPYGVSKRVRRVLEADDVLDLGNERDVADFVLRRRGEGDAASGYESAASTASSVAGDDGDAVSLADDYVGRNNRKGQKKAVKLDEIGPRMELRLVKITEGVPGKEGNVIYHEFVKKTKAEISVQRQPTLPKKKLRRERREEQERNVQRKKVTGQETGVDEEEEDEVEGDEEELEDDGGWDEDEEISEGEESEDDAQEGSDKEDSDDEPERPPAKKVKTKSNRR